MENLPVNVLSGASQNSGSNSQHSKDQAFYVNSSAGHLQKGNLAAALEDAHRCIKLAPSWYKGYLTLAKVLSMKGEFKEAQAVLSGGLVFCLNEDSRNQLLSLQQEIECLVFKKKILGTWKGRVSVDLGGYIQTLIFEDDGKVNIHVMGKINTGEFDIQPSTESALMRLVISFPSISTSVPYIVRFYGDNEIHMCCPYLTTEIPTKFEGPGFVKMKRVVEDDESDESLVNLRVPQNETEKTALYMKLFISTVNQCMQNMPSTDEESLANIKALRMMAVHVKINALETKFGEDFCQRVAMFVTGKETPTDPEIEALGLATRAIMLQYGLLAESEVYAPVSKRNSVTRKSTTGRPKQPSVGAQKPAEKKRLSGFGKIVLFSGGALVLLSAIILIKRLK
jgi:hypothetical protein